MTALEWFYVALVSGVAWDARADIEQMKGRKIQARAFSILATAHWIAAVLVLPTVFIGQPA